MQALMNAEEVAEWLGLSVETVYRKARAGEIPALRVGRRWRFVRGALERWAAGEEPWPGIHQPRRRLSKDELPEFAVHNAGRMRGTLRRVDIYDD